MVYHSPWITMVYHGLLFYGLLWLTMVFYGLLWLTMVYYGLLMLYPLSCRCFFLIGGFELAGGL